MGIQRRIAAAAAALTVAALQTAQGQTTQGLISGRIRDQGSGVSVAGARVSYQSLATNTSGLVVSGPDGYYSCPLLPPGKYRIRAESGTRYQAQEVQELELPVAGRLEIDFELRPLADVFGGGQRAVTLPRSQTIVTFFGPDVDTSRSASFEAAKSRRGALETTVSAVIDPTLVGNLPFGGRDLYTTLVTQPGVAADTATSRGLGLSVNGQRPTASNFLLDGLENNNYTTSGPLTVVAPEAMQEYRVSTNNFSAEYGRAAGFIANAVTKSGGNRWHGIAYFNFRHDRLNANEFQFNAAGVPKAPLRELQPGFQAGGPVVADRLFTSTAVEVLDNDSSSPRPVTLTVASLAFNRLNPFAGSAAKRVMAEFPASGPAAGSAKDRETVTVPQPASQRRVLVLQRMDWLPQQARQRLTGRLSILRLERPEFIWSPYKDFISGLDQQHEGVAVTYQVNYRPGLANEFRGGWNREVLGWDRARPEIPTLVISDGSLVLPGSPAAYAYRNRNRSVELANSLSWIRGRHAAKFGGGLLLRGISGQLTYARDGLAAFPTIFEFFTDEPSFYAVALSRQALPRYRPVANFDREYGYRQWYLFAQDTFRVTPRLVVNYGLRQDSSGGPRNTGAVKDGLVALGDGASFPDRLRGSSLRFGEGNGAQRVFSGGGLNLGARLGVSFAPRADGGTLLRAAVGTFYDRPFDNLWQNVRNNSLTVGRFLTDFGQRVNYLAGAQALLTQLGDQPIETEFPPLIYVDPGLRAGYSQSYLLGVQHQATGSVTAGMHVVGALSRRLITTDVVNRNFSVPTGGGNFTGRYNPALPEVSYVGNQGSANFHALTLTANWRGERGQVHGAYTWSHSIDNQSEPLDSDLFDLGFTRSTATLGASRPRAAFSRQFDSRIDRGSSDFDQRHNLVVFSTWDVWRGWRFSQMSAFRSGFPYSVFAASSRVPPPGRGLLLNSRADLVGGASPEVRRDVAGGVSLLDKAAFAAPSPGLQGTTGRNAFRAPGLYSLDLSFGKTFALGGESRRATVRADFFNALNHANLGAPANQLGATGFGTALFGRQGSPSYFPAQLPFQETGRQIQMLLRFEF